MRSCGKPVVYEYADCDEYLAVCGDWSGSNAETGSPEAAALYDTAARCAAIALEPLSRQGGGIDVHLRGLSHCQALTLQLNPLASEFASRGVQFLQCAINDGAADGLKEFTMKFQPAFPVGWATREAMLSFIGASPMDYNATFVPRMVFLDRLGVIRGNFEPGTEFYQNPPASIRAELEKLLKK